MPVVGSDPPPPPVIENEMIFSPLSPLALELPGPGRQGEPAPQLIPAGAP